MKESSSKHKWLDVLAKISVRINSIRDEDQLLEELLDIAMGALFAERGFILTIAPDSDLGFDIRCHRNFSNEQLDDVLGLSSGVVSHVLRKQEPILVHEALEHEEFGTNESIVLHKVQSIACVPIKLKNKPIGAVYLDSLTRRSQFDHESIPFLRAFADQAAVAIENAQFYRLLSDENRLLRTELNRITGFPEIIGNSPPMLELFELIARLAQSDSSVFIGGESGTGKELVARALHQHGTRKNRPFVAVFCGSISDELIASELFGHKRGAFTGASTDRAGLFEAANGGTIFLDEVADLSPALQVSLLRVLQDGEIRRVGDTKSRHVDVRVVSATNSPILELIEEGKFREDLFYRLNTITLSVPSLRERRLDIPILAHHFLDEFSTSQPNQIAGFAEDALSALQTYPWPGNVRELRSTVERAVILATGSLIEVSDLQLPIVEQLPRLKTGTTIKELERSHTLQTLLDCDGNVSQAARVLGVSRNWIHYKLKEWKS